MTDKELLEFIATQVSTLTKDLDEFRKETNEFRKETNERFDGLECRFDGLESRLEDMDISNADRHVTITRDIRRIKASLSKLEIVTADNWGDIARLKAHRKTK